MTYLYVEDTQKEAFITPSTYTDYDPSPPRSEPDYDPKGDKVDYDPSRSSRRRSRRSEELKPDDEPKKRGRGRSRDYQEEEEQFRPSPMGVPYPGYMAAPYGAYPAGGMPPPIPRTNHPLSIISLTFGIIGTATSGITGLMFLALIAGAVSAMTSSGFYMFGDMLFCGCFFWLIFLAVALGAGITGLVTGILGYFRSKELDIPKGVKLARVGSILGGIGTGIPVVCLVLGIVIIFIMALVM